MFDFETGKLKAWAGKGSIAVIDQAFISGSNFLVNILLARWSSPQEYGAFALAFAIFILLSQFQQSVLLEPMSVFGAGYSGARLKRYYGSLLHMQNGMLVAITVPLALSAVLVQRLEHWQQLSGGLWGVTLASPFVMLLWMARRAFYLENIPAPAAAGAVVYTAVTFGGLLIVRYLGALNAFSAFVVIGAAALVTSLAMLWRLRPEFRRDSRDPAFPEECREHWHYGGWALAGAVAMWLPQNIYYAVLTGADGIAAAGEVRALLNLALPLQRFTVAMGLLLLPFAARVYATHGSRGARNFALKICALFAAGCLAYWGVTLMFGARVFQILYAGKYSSLTRLLPWLAFSSTINALEAAIVIGLRAMRSPASVFYAYGISGVISLLVGIPAAWRWGVDGVMFGFIVANVIAVITSLLMMKRSGEDQKGNLTAGDQVLASEASAF
ncbi:MAG TPA: hypothetical protein VM912_20040 [Terriglobales bacterium]|nr:hypothetical protein [Terriglobales bacterium]